MTKKIMILLVMLVIGTVTVFAESFAGGEKMGEKMLDTFMQRGTYVKIIDSERCKIMYVPKSSISYIRIDTKGGIKIVLGTTAIGVMSDTPIFLDDPKCTPISLDKDCNLILSFLT